MSRGLRRLLILLVLVVGSFGCVNAEIDEMVAGGHIMNGELECWLKLGFDEPPADIVPTDVIVRFHSDALDGVTEFDWAFIAELWWGGEKQDTAKQDIRRLYRAEDDPSTVPGY